MKVYEPVKDTSVNTIEAFLNLHNGELGCGTKTLKN